MEQECDVLALGEARGEVGKGEGGGRGGSEDRGLAEVVRWRGRGEEGQGRKSVTSYSSSSCLTQPAMVQKVDFITLHPGDEDVLSSSSYSSCPSSCSSSTTDSSMASASSSPMAARRPEVVVSGQEEKRRCRRREGGCRKN